MGGYGALKCALRAPETFSCGAGLSAVADIAETVTTVQFSTKRYWEEVFGPLDQVKGSFHDLFAAASDYAAAGQRPQTKFYMWCGTEDFLYAQNTRLRDHMHALGLNLTYEESPGVHAWEYWDLKIQSVLNWLPLKKEEC